MEKQSCLRDFQVLCKLGEGAFGQVYKVKRSADGKEYALKKIRIGSMKPKEKENALNEVRILASYNDEYIIGYKESFYDETSQTLCVVMEFAQGGDLLKKNQNHLKKGTKYKESQIWTALVHMLHGLKSLHDKKILHRDLKCANVFITADNVYKLGDLNVSKVLKKDFACTQTGTPYYASPEVWKDQPYGVKSDMWSLGCVVYQMAALRPPFTAHDLSGLYKKVCTGIFDRIPYQFSNDLQSVVASLLKLDPKKRPTVDQLLADPLVRKNYQGILEMECDQSAADPLLHTIKFNPKDLKGLKKILPKANYIHEEKEDSQSKSCKSIKKEEEKKEIVDQSDRKLKQFIERKRQAEERERQHQLNLIKEQSQEISRKKQRVLSACGIRNQNICLSPRIAVHKKEQLFQVPPINSCRPTKKDQVSLPNARLPPRPQGIPNYKLPPRPNYLPNINAVNKSSDLSQRDSSKQNLKNVGARIVNDYKAPVMTPSNSQKSIERVRCNSAQKIIYPSWWG